MRWECEVTDDDLGIGPGDILMAIEPGGNIFLTLAVVYHRVDAGRM